MDHVHYDLDKVERDIRAMFAKAANTGRIDGKQANVINDWQDRSCEVFVAFMRWQLEMEMSGVDHETHARAVGVLLGDLAQNVWLTFEGMPGKIYFAEAIIEGFISQTNQVMAREAGGVPPDLSMPIDPVMSGRA